VPSGGAACWTASRTNALRAARQEFQDSRSDLHRLLRKHRVARARYIDDRGPLRKLHRQSLRVLAWSRHIFCALQHEDRSDPATPPFANGATRVCGSPRHSIAVELLRVEPDLKIGNGSFDVDVLMGCANRNDNDVARAHPTAQTVLDRRTDRVLSPGFRPRW
jgi:hypothetical protein